jgi:hypothetical protein
VMVGEPVAVTPALLPDLPRRGRGRLIDAGLVGAEPQGLVFGCGWVVDRKLLPVAIVGRSWLFGGISGARARIA